MPIYVGRDLLDEFESDAIGQQAKLTQQAIAAAPPIPDAGPPPPAAPPSRDDWQSAPAQPPAPTDTSSQPPPSLQDLMATAGLASQPSGGAAVDSTPSTAAPDTPPASSGPPALSDLLKTAGLGDAANTVRSAAGNVATAVTSTAPRALSDLMSTAGLAGQQASNAVTQKVDQVQQAVQSVAQPSSRISQFESGLSDADAYAACGPVAAVAFAQAHGRNPTPQEALELAKKVGWSQGQGMAGVSSEAALLKEMGISAHVESDVNWQHVAQDASSANPVIISTPGHYYVVDGYDSQTGRFHEATRAERDLKGGSEWMSADDMQRLMGTANGALYADNPNAPDSSVARAQPSTVTTAGMSGGGATAGQVGDRGMQILNGASQAASWLGDQGQKAVQAVLMTEGGLNNARGDNGKSAGPLQFYEEGQLATFAQQMGMNLDQAKQWVEQNPVAAVQWAIGTPDKPGYLGQAIQRGIQQGLSGPDLATFAQRTGQVSDSPERAGANWNALFGAGQGLVQAAGGAAQGAVQGAQGAAQGLLSNANNLVAQGQGLINNANQGVQSLADYTQQKLAPINAEADRLTAANQQASDQTLQANQTAQDQRSVAASQATASGGPLGAVKQKFSDALDALGNMLGGLGQAAQTAPLEGGGYGSAPAGAPGAAQAQLAQAGGQVGQALQAGTQSPLMPSNILSGAEQAVGQGVGRVLSGQSTKDLAGYLEDQATQADQGPLAAPLGPGIPAPVQSGALRVAAGFLRQPSVVDQLKTAGDIVQKYPDLDPNKMTPEDRDAYLNAMLAVAGVTSPLAVEGGIEKALLSAGAQGGLESALLNRFKGGITRTGEDVRPGLVGPGELGTMSSRENLPNAAIWEATPGARYSDAEGEFGYHPPPVTQTPLVPGTENLPQQQRVRQVVADLVPNERIPRDLQDPQANVFAEAMRANGASVGRGEWTPEQTTLSALLTRFSQGRGQTPAAKMYSGLGEEFMLRQRPSLQTQGASTGGASSYGLVIRPETMAAHIAGDTANPDMMEMLTAISRPSAEEVAPGTPMSQISFATRQERAQAIQQGVDEFYRLAQTAGQGGDRGDRALITGAPIIRQGIPTGSTGRQAWSEAIPELHRTIQEWGSMTGRYAGLDQAGAKAQLLEDLQNAGVAGIGIDKAPFVANMGFSPEYGILDLRMRRQVFGLSPKAQITRAERDVLEQKLADAWPNANSNYVAQWLPWAYMTDEKTDYTSVASAYKDVGSFMQHAQQIADQEGRPLGEVVRGLAEQTPKLPVDFLTDPQDVITRIGISPQVVKQLPPGTSGETLRKAAPELEAFRRQAGVTFVEKPSVGTGLGIGPDGQPITEPDADLLLHGPQTANRYFGAAWLAANPNEDSIMLAHLGRGGSDSLATVELKGVTSPEDLANLHEALTQVSPDGWHTKVRLDKTGGQEVTHIVIGGVGKDVSTFEPEVRSLIQDLRDSRYNVTSSRVEPAQIEFMGQSDVPEVLYGGPRGATTRDATEAAQAEAGRTAPRAGQPLGGSEPGVGSGAGGGANAPPVRDVAAPAAEPGGAGPATAAPGAAAGRPAAAGANGPTPSLPPTLRSLAGARQGGFTGAQFATTIGGAAAGGAEGYNSDENAPLPERLGRAAAGAAIGGALGYGAARGVERVFGEAPAAAAEDMAGATGAGRQSAQLNLGQPPAIPQQGQLPLSGFGQELPVGAPPVARESGQAPATPQVGQLPIPGFGRDLPVGQVQQVAKQIGADVDPSRAFDLNALAQMRQQFQAQQPPLLQTAQKAPNPLDRFIGYTMANMLWGVGTAVHITTSQALQTLGRPVITAASGHPVDAVRDATAMASSISDAFARFGRTIQTGQRQGLALQAPLAPTAAEQVLQFPLRVHSAINEFYRTLNSAGGAAMEASRRLRENPNLSFQDVLQRYPQDIVDAGAHAAARATFMEGGGAMREIGSYIGKASRDLTNSSDPTQKAAGLVLRWVVPMTHIPAVILGEGIRGLPVVNEVRGVQRAAQLASSGDHYGAQQELGRTALTSFANLAVLNEVAQGNITGDGPTSPAEKARLMEGVDDKGNATWRPNSIRLPDGRWLDYTGLGPIALSMSSIANLVEAAKDYANQPPEKRTGGAPQLAQDLLGREAGTIGQTWFLRGLADVLTAVKEGTVGGTGTQISQAGDRLVPFGALLNEAKNLTDPLARDPQGPLERIQSRLPILSQDIRPRLGATTGQPEEQPHDLASILFRSTPPGMMTPNPVAAEIDRLGTAGNNVSVPYQVKSYKGADQTPEAQQAIRQQVGQAVNQYVLHTISDPRYQGLDDAQKANAISAAVGQAQSAADITLDQQVARSPHDSALLQWSQTPQYAGISSKLPPEEIARQNWEIQQARAKMSEYRAQYQDQAENRLRRDDPQAYKLAQRDPLDSDVIKRKKAAIDRATGGALSQVDEKAAAGGLVGAGATTLKPPVRQP